MIENKKKLFHVFFSCVSKEEFIYDLSNRILEKKKTTIVTPNLDFLRNSYKDKYYLETINNSTFSTVDGTILRWLAKLFKVTALLNFSGSDLVFPILDLANEKQFSLLLIGGKNQVLENAKNYIETNYTNIIIKGTYSPKYGFEKDNDETKQIINYINENMADIVLFCCGSPKSEVFCNKNRLLLPNSTFCFFGATIDFLAGNIKRAPKWISAIGMEWLYRLFKEPKRLFKRYLLDGLFLFKIIFIRLFKKSKLENMADQSIKVYSYDNIRGDENENRN